MSGAVRVLLADDHVPTRDDIRRALAADSRFAVCAEAGDAAAAIDGAVREGPDICILDVRMPGGGVAAAWEISTRLPQTKIVMLTVSRDDTDLFASLRAGAAGYLLKDMDPAQLPNALGDVLNGEAALPPELVARVIDEFRDRSPRRRAVLASGGYETLTSREWQVLDLLRQELTTAAIARRLVVSPVTVRSHVNNILRKVRAESREALLQDFEERG
ncbi:MAG: response regulator [Gaiellaceae bacterium]